MRFLRNALDKMEPHFHEGGKFKFFYPLFEAADTFFFSLKDTTTGRVHLRDGLDLKRMMTFVMIALIPCIFFGVYNVGHQAALAGGEMSGIRGEIVTMLGLSLSDGIVAQFLYGLTYFLPIYITAFVAGLIWEVLISMIRGHEVSEGFFVTSILFPLIVPPTTPLWQVFIAMSFAIILGKEVFGGTGMNFMNPALIARAFLFFAYPAQISGDKVWTVVDGVSKATPLSTFAANGTAGDITLLDAFIGNLSGSIGEVSTLFCIVAALFLILTKVASWRIIIGGVVGMTLMALFFNMLHSFGYVQGSMYAVNPLWHFSLGGFAFGLVFMATDPVTAPHTINARLLYGVFIGVMCVVIRTLNVAYPEGMMLAILLGNMVAPLMDFFVVEANVKRRRRRYAQ